MNPAQAHLVEQLRARFGAAVALTEPEDIAPWLTDWRGRWHGASPALLQPDTIEAAAHIVALARDGGVALTPQGGNSSMVGGATPPSDGSSLIVSLRRLNAIRAVEPGFAIAEAGVILETLHNAAGETGQRFPLTLGAKGSATIGGLVSTNAGGTQVLRFGTMRSLVEGLEAVLPDGSIHRGLSGLKKDNRGPSLDHLLIGAEGTLGIVTAARLRIVPAFVTRSVAWLGLASPAAALDVLRALEAVTDRVEGFEILPDESLGAALDHIPGTRLPLAERYPWYALVEATSESDDPVDLAALLMPLIEQGVVSDASIASSEAQAAAMWRIRDSLSQAERAAFGPATQHDISVAVDAMPAFLESAAKAVEAAFPGTHASGFGHLGDGNIHFHVRAGSRGSDSWVEEEGVAVSRLVNDLVAAAGGSISAEHGIGQMKRSELARLDPARVAHLRAIKAALDPGGLFNPGKLV
ncbi:MAG: FAD-binding oxidoreductase [Pseudomonadota bacterium]|nr:FAD-binding oxidoreductase [Pseudomonadota bacterium]